MTGRVWLMDGRLERLRRKVLVHLTVRNSRQEDAQRYVSSLLDGPMLKFVSKS